MCACNGVVFTEQQLNVANSQLVDVVLNTGVVML